MTEGLDVRFILAGGNGAAVRSADKQAEKRYIRRSWNVRFWVGAE
ncbi:hypothetical protein [Sphingomonas sp. MA1305]|nr:hypothetical protein [Sphingomonas sp. MA1305]